MQNTIVPIASDHRGFALKAKMLAWLTQHGFQPHDLGTDADNRCDASDFAQKMAQEFSSNFKSNAGQFGVLICGTGQAMAMTANRYRYLRAALCANTSLARLAREHNDANILVIGADMVGEGLALECLEVFLRTKFLGVRYAERLAKMTAIGGVE